MGYSERVLWSSRVAAFILAQASAALAAGADGWVSSQSQPALAGVKSALILRDDEPLYRSPSPRAARRGTAARGAHLPVFEAQRAPGCSGNWLSVGPIAWVCDQVVQLSAHEALPARALAPPSEDGLPHRYFFVGDNGTFGYRHFSTAEQGAPDAQLEPGFAVAIMQLRAHVPEDPFGLTTRNLWLPMRDLRAARPSEFRGIHEPELSDAWVVSDHARARTGPAAPARGPEYPRLSRVSILETRLHAGKHWYRIAAAQWLGEQDLAVRTQAPMPGGIGPGERWIDVELAEQILTAYVGEVPVFSTLVSSGRGSGAAENATPLGEHRIWVKLRTSDMDNLEDPEASRYYAIQSVPWVMYFRKGYGLHGAFWHRDFGRVRSHGCVNLSPLDAHWLFFWSAPHLPAGWTAVFPTRYERGTLVRVR